MTTSQATAIRVNYITTVTPFLCMHCVKALCGRKFEHIKLFTTFPNVKNTNENGLKWLKKSEDIVKEKGER